MTRFLLSCIALALLTSHLPAQDIPLSKILVDKEGWREIAKGVPGITLLEAERTGAIAVYQPARLFRIPPGGKLEKIIPKDALDLPPTGRAQMALSSSNREYFIAGDVNPVVQMREKTTTHTLKLPGLKAPNCLTLWPDEGHLVVGESDGAYLWAIRIEKDGTFGPGDRYYSLRTRPNEKLPVAAMTMDAGYLLYACTPLGVQVFDPTGRLSGVIPAPAKGALTAIAIGGEKADMLFVACGDAIYARKIQGKSAYTLKK